MYVVEGNKSFIRTHHSAPPPQAVPVSVSSLPLLLSVVGRRLTVPITRSQANSPKLQTRLQAFTDWYSKAVIALTLGAVAALRLFGVPLLGTATEVRRSSRLPAAILSACQGPMRHAFCLSRNWWA